MEKKDDKVDILVLIVMFVSALLFIVSLVGMFGELAGSVLIGSSILVTGSLIARAMQWAGKE
jgi:hypothetical protein